MNSTTQSEAALENELIAQLEGMDYENVPIRDDAAMLANLRVQINKHNAKELNATGGALTDEEFQHILHHLNQGNVYDRAQHLRDRYALKRQANTKLTAHIRFLDTEAWCKNEYQVTHQIKNIGARHNRYDVTILINGLPLVQIELKRRGVEIKEAFHQIERYQHDSYDAGHGLFKYVQLFIISNGVNTKYFANGVAKGRFEHTFYWTDEANHRYSNLSEFARTFLKTCHVSKMITHYMVLATDKSIRVLRPYQYYAVEGIVKQVEESANNAYIWHTTGSGKTLTSFKASQIIKLMPKVSKVLFVVDRRDLDYQTAFEFNAFEDGCVDETTNTANLVKKLKDTSDASKLIITTLQKLDRAIVSSRFKDQIAHLQDQKIVFIFDECHRSQFGRTHNRIKNFFSQAQMFGFTGTPILAENAHKVGKHARTTRDLFGECLHKYTIVDAIRDENVLKFMVEYVGKYKTKESANELDIETNGDIDKKELLESKQRLSAIVDYILQHHRAKTFIKGKARKEAFTGMLCVSNVATLIKYYEIFKEKQKDSADPLTIATIFSFNENTERLEDDNEILENDEVPEIPEQSQQIDKSSSDKLDEFIADYNQRFNTKYSTTDSQSYYNYYKDISKRVRNREIDILLVVNMFLTGFDSPPLNTLYVDKNLKQHGLIQAYSRTNRLCGERKKHGNIVAFRNLKKATDDAITLFSNRDAKDTVIVKPYEHYVEQYNEAVDKLKTITPHVDDVDELLTEDDELEFVLAFRTLMRLQAILVTFADFEPKDLKLHPQEFEDYQSKYLDIRDKVKNESTKEKISVLGEVDFETELIHTDLINVRYIINLLENLKGKSQKQQNKTREHIEKLLSTTEQLRSKRELIEEFIRNNDLELAQNTNLHDRFDTFWAEKRKQGLQQICEQEKLNPQAIHKIISNYLTYDRLPRNDEIRDALTYKPDIFDVEEIQARIAQKIANYIETFYENMG